MMTGQSSKTTSAGVDKPAPTVTAEAASKIQAIIIQQQAISMQMKQLEDSYKQLQQKAQDLAKASNDAQSAALKGAGLDEAKYQISVSQDGKVTAVPKPDTAPATPSTDKK